MTKNHRAGRLFWWGGCYQLVVPLKLVVRKPDCGKPRDNTVKILCFYLVILSSVHPGAIFEILLF